MRWRNGQRHGIAVCVCAIACGPVTALALVTVSQPPTDHDGPAPIFGCGGAEAMAPWLIPCPTPSVDNAYQEAMADTDVLHYELDLEVSDLNTSTHTCTLTGSNRMTIVSKSDALRQFSFRLHGRYAITSVLVNDATPVTVTKLSNTTRLVTLDQTYGMDDSFTLTIVYVGPSQSEGGWGSFLVQTVPGGDTIVSTMGCPYYSCTWWPVKDGDVDTPGDHSDKATIELSITVPANLIVAATGELRGVDTLSGNRKRYDWATGYPIAPYLVCFSGTEYNTWTRDYEYPGGSMPVEFYIYPAWDNGSNRAAWDKVIDMLEVYRPLFGEYPFIEEKYGIYNFPFGGGMEHQTLTGQGTFSESVTAHELSHQWWGDMITCKTWCHVWLNEGFATYAESLWEEWKSGTQDLTAYFNTMQSNKPLKSSIGGTVYVPPEDTDDIGRIFNREMSYRKGAWVLHHLRHVVGDGVFYEILANYRNAYAFSSATTEDFAAVASNTAGTDLTWLFDQWVYQPGWPSYQYGWSTASAGGVDYLLMMIAQTQGGACPEVFIMPVDVVATVNRTDETLTVWNDARTEWFVVPVGGPVTGLQFDPNQWILRSSAGDVGYRPGPPKIVTTNPAPGARVDSDTAVDTVTITFHTEVDLDAADLSLVGANTGPQAFTIAATGTVNPVVLELDAPLEVDTYTLTVTDGVTAVDSGMALDGEVASPIDPGSLPSGDGESGGMAVVKFIVVASPVPSVSR